jgi:hypothetical protein
LAALEARKLERRENVVIILDATGVAGEDG